MSHHVYNTTRDGRAFEGNLLEISGYATENIVERHKDGNVTVLHSADFPSQRLGSADRDEYLRVTTASIIDAEARAQRKAAREAAQ